MANIWVQALIGKRRPPTFRRTLTQITRRWENGGRRRCVRCPHAAVYRAGHASRAYDNVLTFVMCNACVFLRFVGDVNEQRRVRWPSCWTTWRRCRPRSPRWTPPSRFAVSKALRMRSMWYCGLNRTAAGVLRALDLSRSSRRRPAWASCRSRTTRCSTTPRWSSSSRCSRYKRVDLRAQVVEKVSWTHPCSCCGATGSLDRSSSNPTR